MDNRPTSLRERIIREARRIEEDSLYSAKRHFTEASVWTNFRLAVGIPTAIMAALAGASALASFDEHNVVAGVLALVVTASTAVSTFLNPNEQASVHHKAGSSYNSLKSRVRMFHEIDCHDDSQSEDALNNRLRGLAKERDELNEASPPTSRWSFIVARRGIEQGEASYAVDEGESH